MCAEKEAAADFAFVVSLLPRTALKPSRRVVLRHYFYPHPRSAVRTPKLDRIRFHPRDASAFSGTILILKSSGFSTRLRTNPSSAQIIKILVL
jgi:hypothetical protein